MTSDTQTGPAPFAGIAGADSSQPTTPAPPDEAFGELGPILAFTFILWLAIVAGVALSL
jgi:hypothetical protein